MTLIKYWLEFTLFYTLCLLSIPMAPFVFLWVVTMRALEDYQEYRSYKEELTQLKGE